MLGRIRLLIERINSTFEPMDAKKIDWLNIGLIFISLILAIQLPFKLFLFSYAFLGPLHYLTEINWLDEKNYFIKSSKKWMIGFVVVAILFSLYPIYQLIGNNPTDQLNDFALLIAQNGGAFLVASLFFAAGLFFLQKTPQVLIALVLSVALALSMTYLLPKALLYVGVFLPTLIHVYLFTLLFMWFGAKKSKSKVGKASVICLALVPFLIMIWDIDGSTYTLSDYDINAMTDSNFFSVTREIVSLFGGWTEGTFSVISDMAIKAQIFLAFAYTYHYLNWFSKTSIIGWKKALTQKKIIGIVVAWGFTSAIYLYDFKIGFVALFFLSFLHVFLEFPLNVATIKGLFSKGK
ncbi:MAG: hypothetical protein ACPG4Z_05755 [Chitinophagales bacterium]